MFKKENTGEAAYIKHLQSGHYDVLDTLREMVDYRGVSYIEKGKKYPGLFIIKSVSPLFVSIKEEEVSKFGISLNEMKKGDRLIIEKGEITQYLRT